MAEKFIRPEVTAYEAEQVKRASRKILMVQGKLGIGVALMVLMGENIRLTKEVNLHREKLGYEPLPIHELKV